MGFEDLAFAGAARQAELLRLGEVSSRELVEGYLERIGRLEPRVNAFRAVYFERALAEADQADDRLRAGDERPLLGVPIALASDGGGSIRIPAACCGLFGIKPQRGRVSLAPLREHWHRLTSIGPLARRVIDAALFLDAAAGPAPGDADVPPPPPRPFLDSARSEPERLRVAVSYRPPMAARVADEALRPVRQTADLLRSLGHDVVEHEPRYGELRT